MTRSASSNESALTVRALTGWPGTPIFLTIEKAAIIQAEMSENKEGAGSMPAPSGSLSRLGRCDGEGMPAGAHFGSGDFVNAECLSNIKLRSLTTVSYSFASNNHRDVAKPSDAL